MTRVRMSPLQYGTLKYIIGHQVTIEHARLLSNVTLGSLLHNGWIARKGSMIEPTREGQEAFDSYHRAEPNRRTHEADLSDRVQQQLHIADLSVMKKKA